jgi:hypothetical protein
MGQGKDFPDCMGEEWATTSHESNHAPAAVCSGFVGQVSDLSAQVKDFRYNSVRARKPSTNAATHKRTRPVRLCVSRIQHLGGRRIAATPPVSGCAAGGGFCAVLVQGVYQQQGATFVQGEDTCQQQGQTNLFYVPRWI